MKILVIADPSDTTAVCVAALLLHRHGTAAVSVRTPAEIVLAERWEHRVRDAHVETRLDTHGGECLVGLSVIFNRLRAFDEALMFPDSLEDRTYAQAEIAALLVSWLANAGCPVVNAPADSALTNQHRPIVWQRRALRAGLPTADLFVTTSSRRFRVPSGLAAKPELSWCSFEASSRFRVNQFGWYTALGALAVRSVHVIGERAFGPLPDTLLQGCLRLARSAHLDLLRVDFSPSVEAPDGFVFAGADPSPSFDDPQLIEALADRLEGLAAALPSAAP